MPQDTPLISTIVAGLVLAFIFGAIAHRFKLPPLIGYLIAGVVCGPYTPGFVANGELATELSELGVILLMFGVGLHFSLHDLLSVRALAIPGALVQIVGATILGVIMALVLGWSLGAGLIFGLALSVASTVVLLKALQDRHIVDSEKGKIAVGWLIVEDMAMVLALVLIPALSGVLGGNTVAIHDPFVAFIERLTGGHLNVVGVLAITLVKLAAFVGFMLIVGRRLIPWLLHLTAHTGSRELFRLAVLAIALGVAAGSAYLFGVSLALGAFFAGMILSESQLSQRAAQETLPLRDAFAVLFFVSVGMLFDPAILIHSPLAVLGTVLIILVGKSALALGIVLAFRQPVGTALTISASLAQIGEFSFILVGLGVGLGILPQEGQDLVLAGAILSILLNPLIFFIADRLQPQFEARLAGRRRVIVPNRVEPDLGAEIAEPVAEAEPIDERRPITLSRHAVVIGFGRVGSVVAEGLRQRGIAFVVIDDADNRIAAARAAGVEVVTGNAATPATLELASVGVASMVFVAIPNAFEAGQAVQQCRRQNSGVRIVARAHSDEEITYLRDLGADEVIMGEREIALGMVDWAAPATRRSAAAEEALTLLRPSEPIVADAGVQYASSAPAVSVAPVRPVATVLAPTPARVVTSALVDAPPPELARAVAPMEDEAEPTVPLADGLPTYRPDDLVPDELKVVAPFESPVHSHVDPVPVVAQPAEPAAIAPRTPSVDAPSPEAAQDVAAAIAHVPPVAAEPPRPQPRKPFAPATEPGVAFQAEPVFNPEAPPDDD